MVALGPYLSTNRCLDVRVHDDAGIIASLPAAATSVLPHWTAMRTDAGEVYYCNYGTRTNASGDDVGGWVQLK